MMEDKPWHELQDRQITEKLGEHEEQNNDPSAIRRIFVGCADFGNRKHVLNLAMRFKRSDRFSVLDLGCGTGLFLSEVAALFPNAELHGSDANEASLAIAQKSVPRASFTSSMFENVEGRFDVVVCCQVYEHVDRPDLLLDALFRLAKPGGLISFSMPSGWIYRRPRLGNFIHALRDWGFYRRVRLQPERHWQEALPHHPAVQPSKLIRQFRARGGTIMLRSSSIWMVRDEGPMVRFCRLFGEVRGAALFHGLMLTAEGLMEVFPPLRIFELRFLLAVETPQKRVSA